MRYEILGPIRVTRDGTEFTLSASKTEVLFATLLIRANHLVSGDHLLTELWGDEPPRRACAGLYVYISQLRKFLLEIRRSRNPIQTRSPGYLLELGPDELDLHAFQRSMNNGRHALSDGRTAQAAAHLEHALSLWRGTALGAINGGPIVNGFKVWLEESRLECFELLMKARLAQGQHTEAVGSLYFLIAEYPLRETFYQLLMIALYRSGRQAEALRIYQQARHLLIEEIGLEPCRPMRDLHQAILMEDLDLCTHLSM